MRSRLAGGVVLAIVVAVAVFGVLAELAAFGPEGYASASTTATDPWILDLVTGYVILASGAIAVTRRPASLVGPLFILAAIAWFLGTLIEPGRFIGTALSPSVVFLYRGFLAHAILTFPTGRPADSVEWVAVILAYASSLFAPLWYSESGGPILLALLVGVTYRGYRRARGQVKVDRRAALTAASLLAVAVVVLTTARFWDVPYPLDDATTIIFHVVLMAATLMLALALARSERTHLTDMVVELGASDTRTLRDVLSRLLGDPNITLGTWSSGAGAYFDEAGRAVAPPGAGLDRAATQVDQDGRPVALIVHDRALLKDSDLRHAVADAVRLAVANAQLRARVTAQVVELAASRRRLIVAADAEGERLARRLSDGAERHLHVAGDQLESAALAARNHDAKPTFAAIERALLRQGHLIDDLRGLASGLHPSLPAEAGLEAGLAELARECPVPVDLVLEVKGVPPKLAVEIFLVCAEALTNVAKHAGAGRARIEATLHGDRVRLVVVDDGVGGAAFGRGVGLSGLADRIASLGGTMALRSEPGEGTRLIISIPVAGPRHPDTTPPTAHVETRTRAPTISPVSTDALPSGRP